MDRFNVVKKREFVKDKNGIQEFRREILCLSDFGIKSILVRRELEYEMKRIVSETNRDYLDKIYVTDNPDHFPSTVVLTGYSKPDYRYKELKFQLFEQKIEIDKESLDNRIWELLSQTYIRCYYLLMNIYTHNMLVDKELIERNKEYGTCDFYMYKKFKIPVIVTENICLNFGDVEVVYNNEEKNLITKRFLGGK